MSAITIAVASLAIVVSGALVTLTTLLHRTGESLASTIEGVHLAEETELDLLLHERSANPLVRRSLDGDIRKRLADVDRYVQTEEGEQSLAAARAAVDAYLTAARAEVPPDELKRRHEAAYGAIERFVDAKVARSERERDNAEMMNRLADGIGIATAVLVLAVSGWLFWWLRRAFGSVFALAKAMERFGRGDRAARAREEGPRELCDIAERFNQMASALQTLREQQIAFLASVAHDLRNPLSALTLSLGMVRPDRALPDEPRLRRALAIAQRQTSHMDRMIGDFLDTARIEAGQLELQKSERDLRPLVAEVVELFESTSPDRRIELSLPAAPLPIVCDAQRIGQVVGNLLSNALKYAPESSATEVTVVEDRDEAVVSVTDHGIGIAADDQRRLFEPFRRSGRSKQTIPGLGLGLFAAQRIVEAHGGRVEVESTLGRGSCFRVHLPLAAADAREESAEQPDERPIH